MTKFLAICIILLMVCQSHGQGFNTYYPSGSGSLAIKSQSLNANEFVVTNYFTDSLSGDQGLDLRKIDNQGLTLLRKRYLFYGRSFSTFLYNNIQTNVSNSTMLLTGGSYIDTASAVIFVSANRYTLDTNWTRYYADGIYNYYIDNVFRVKPNEVWFMGSRGNNNGYANRPFVFKMDTLGNLLATKDFTALINYDPLRIFYDYPNGLIYFAGLKYPTPSTRQSYVACMDTSGNVIWNQQIGNYPYSTYFYEVQKKNNYLIITGGKGAGTIAGMPSEKLTLTKLNAANGSLIWEKSYGAAGIDAYLSGFTINPDESIVATGTYELVNNNVLNRDGIIFKANSNGDSLWLKSYGSYTGSVEEGFFDIQPTPDGGYMMCGAPFFSSNDRSWVVKTDSLGIGPGVVTSTLVTGIDEIDLSKEGYTFFPNPATDKVYISSTSNQNLHLIIYNNTGQLLREEELVLKDGLATLKTNDLANGIYLVNLYNSHNLLVKSSKLIISK